MTAGNTCSRLLYGGAFRVARNTKNRYHRKNMEVFNRSLAKQMAGSWDEASRREAYRRDVLPYWKQFGRRPKRFWFELAGSRDHRMDPRYIPSDLYYYELLPYLNNLPFYYALEDKNYLDLRFPDVKQAPTVCRRIAGEYYDETMALIGLDDAARLCMEREGDLFIKPSLYTGFGKGIQTFAPSACTVERIKALFLEAGTNFIVQEKIRQHRALEALNPESVSTIRVCSLFVQCSVSIANVYLRVGVSGTTHVTVGREYNAELLPDGRLSPKVCLDEGRWFDSRQDRIFADEIVIPGVDRVLAEAKRLHPRVGHLKWIGWDFTVNAEGDPLLIEFNATPGDNAQRVCGRPLFGEMTEWVLADYFCNRSMEDFQLRGCWCTNEDIARYLA